MTTKVKGIAYASASSDRARGDTIKMLRCFGCEEIGFADNYAKHEVLLYFKHRGRQIKFEVSAQGWAARYLRAKPWTPNRRSSRVDYEQAALRQGHVAVNSVIRDWVKAQLSAVECGIASFEACFMPWTLTADGRPVIERLAEMNLLPSPESAKVVALKG